MDKKSSEYKLIRMADTSFLFCIVFEVVGIMAVMFLGTLGARMAIYFMTMLFAVFMARKRRAEFTIPFEKPKAGTLLQSIGISVCGIPIALMLSALASLLSSAGADSSEDIAKYPVWLAIIAFAIVPAVVEEYVFRGLILGAYMKVDARAAVVISSLFFALLHFSLGSILYGFFYGCVFALIRIATGNMMYLLEVYLSNDGYSVYKCYNGLEAMKCIKQSQIDLAILDIMLPDIDGFRLCQKIREKFYFPIIMLTAKIEDSDKIMGLTIGADDYITKPFNPLEVVARVKTQLRRYQSYNSPNLSQSEEKDEYDIRGLLINRVSHKCYLYGKEIALTPLEFSILWYLCEHQGKVVASEELFEAVWKEKYLRNSNNTVMAHIGRLREKLNEPSKNPKFIKTVWGVGYEIE